MIKLGTTERSYPWGVLAEKGLPWLETRLADDREWICGNLSMADAGLAAMAMVLQADDFELDEFPALAAYFERIRGRRAYLAISPKTSLEDSLRA